MNILLAKAQVVWPFAVTLTPLVIAGAVLWLRTKFPGVEAFNQSQIKIATLETKVSLLEAKVEELDGDIDSEPTRAQLLDKMGNAIERLSRLEGSFEAIERHMGAQSQWIQALALQPEGRR